MATRGECFVEGCDKAAWSRTWCTVHYGRWRRYGDPARRTAADREDGAKTCPACSVITPLSQFGARPGGPCLPCQARRRVSARLFNPALRTVPIYVPEIGRAKTTAWRVANPSKSRAHAHMRRARRRGATVEVFDPLEIFERDEWTCGICHVEIDRERAYPDSLSPSLDHVIPLSRGGAHARSNVQATHLTCNLRKYNKTSVEVA